MANLDIQPVPLRRAPLLRKTRGHRASAAAPASVPASVSAFGGGAPAAKALAARADIAPLRLEMEMSSLGAGGAAGAAAADSAAHLALVTAPARQAPVDAPHHAPARAPLFSYQRAGKRALDLVFLALFLPVYLPVIGLAALALMIEGGRPFYRQDRLGRDGERFSILKLRTMVPDAEARLEALLAQDPALRREWEIAQKLKKDPRITRVGEILRRTSLDELPQLWNVATGQMSLVGPRPMMPDQLPLYGDPQDYFALRPGITGLWQVDRRNESSFAERAHYDSAYRREMSLLRDLKVLLQTIGVVLRRTGC